MRKNQEKILTLHPSGKQGVRIHRHKYEQVKKLILATFKNKSVVSFDELSDRVEKELNRLGFNGKPLWYIVTVKLDLEARKIIERIPSDKKQAGSHKLRLTPTAPVR